MTRTATTSSSICRLLLTDLLALLCLSAMAQGRAGEERQDSTPLFRGVAVSADLVGLGQKVFGNYGQLEAAVRVNLRDRYFPIIEVGLGKADADDVATGLNYKTSAPYGRLGVDFNLLKNKHDDYRLYIGGRYGFSSFKYDVFSPGITDPVYGGTEPFDYRDNKGSFHWLELVGGVDAKIWRFIRLGWSVRYKRRLLHKEAEIGSPWYVPGFGRYGGTRLGATFNVIFEL